MEKLITYIFIAVFTAPIFGYGQNLVPNPGFEEIYHCQYGAIDTTFTTSRGVMFWRSPAVKISTFLTDCMVHYNREQIASLWHYPRTDSSYAMIGVYSKNNTLLKRSYVQTKLQEPLKLGCIYLVTFHVRPRGFVGPAWNAENPVAIDRIGAYFSVNPVENFTNTNNGSLILIPSVQNTSGNILDDTTKYYEISGLYYPGGDEEYLTIGNFAKDSDVQITFYDSTVGDSNIRSIYLVDDVSVIPVIPPNYETELGNDTFICVADTLLLSANNLFSYEWSTGDTTQSIKVSQPGKYWVKGRFYCGYYSDTIEVSFHPDPGEIQLANDTSVCLSAPDSIRIQINPDYESYLWSNGDTSYFTYVKNSGWVSVTASTNCYEYIDSILVDIYDTTKYVLDIGTDTVLCSGNDTILLNAQNNFTSYIWNTNETSSSISVSSPGIYSVKATYYCKTLIDSVRVDARKNFTPPADTFICTQNAFSFPAFVQPDDENILWSTGSQSNKISISDTGAYWVEVTDRCGKRKESFRVERFDPSEYPLDIGADTIICENNPLKIGTDKTFVSLLWNTGETTSHIWANDTGTYILTAYTDKGCPVTDSIIILDKLFPPAPYSVNDTFICEEGAVYIAVPEEAGTSIFWQDGFQGYSRIINNPGTYNFTLENICGGTGTKFQVQEFWCSPTVFIPNVFSPGNDTLNVLFYPVSKSLHSYSLTIFNRWGQEIFKGDINEAWNGMFRNVPVPEGVYVYKLRYKYYSQNGLGEKWASGTVTVLR